jgi:uncharacterized protein (DUF2267 family)
MDEVGFIREVGARLDLDKEGAQVITFAVLQVLRSRLTAKEVSHLDAQLPTRLKRLRAGRSIEPKANRFDKTEFFRRVGLLAGLPQEEAQNATKVVFKVLQEAFQSPTGHEGDAWGVFSQLPKDLKKIWCDASHLSD